MRSTNHQSTSNHRSGFTMVELTAAAALLGTVFVVTLPLLQHVRLTRDAAQRQFIAQQEAANIMERLALQAPLESLDESMTLSPEAASCLPQGDVTLTRQPSDDGMDRVTVSVSWINETGEPQTSVMLTAWLPAAEEVP